MARRPAHEQGDTVSDIRTAAFRLFGRYGYDGVSIGDIADAAALSKGALYWHFQGKGELFLDCLDRLHQMFETVIFEPMADEPDALQRILCLFKGLDALSQDPQVRAGVGGYWLGTGNPGLERARFAQQAFESRTAAQIRAALALGMEQGRLNLHADLDDMSRATIAVMEAIILPLREHSAEEAHAILSVLARTMFRAYATSDEAVAVAKQF